MEAQAESSQQNHVFFNKERSCAFYLQNAAMGGTKFVESDAERSDMRDEANQIGQFWSSPAMVPATG
jgi:hypothetical protein